MQDNNMEELSEYVKRAIASDQEEMLDALSKNPKLNMVECCPHSSADSEYIGDGDTQHTCRCCGYYFITSNPRYHE